MIMTVKDLIEELKTMDQDAEIQVAGGYTEYGTNNVVVFEHGDKVNIQEG